MPSANVGSPTCSCHRETGSLAARAIGRLENPAYRDALIPLLHSPDPLVRRQRRAFTWKRNVVLPTPPLLLNRLRVQRCPNGEKLSQIWLPESYRVGFHLGAQV